jgi:hypothetical protein
MRERLKRRKGVCRVGVEVEVQNLKMNGMEFCCICSGSYVNYRDS